MSIDSLFQNFFATQKIIQLAQAIILLALGYIIARIVRFAVSNAVNSRLSPHGRELAKRFSFYAIFILFAVSAFESLGFGLTALLGAAGILTVAIGFASQTSASNLISGLFLMLERPFSIADIISVGNTRGEVISIDLLSVKLRTFDNLFIRIPNETMIKSEVTTLTKYPIRRLDLMLGVAYKEDIERVKDLLLAIADRHALCLDEPSPIFFFQGFGASSVDLQLSVWVKRENFLTVKNELLQEIKRCFDNQGIEIPFPHMSLYVGSESKALPVSVLQQAPQPTHDVSTEKPEQEHVK